MRRVDAGDPIDTVLFDHPHEAGWLRDHLIVSSALQLANEPSVEKKTRARQSLLAAVARSDPPSLVASRPRFNFAVAPAALVILISLGLTAGVAAASGVNLRSVAIDVVDTLVEPLPLSAPPPLSAETLEDPIGLDPGERASGVDTVGVEHPIRQPDDGGIDEAAADDGISDDTNLPVPGGPSNQMNPPGNNPTSTAGSPSGNHPPQDGNQGGQYDPQPAETPAPSHHPHGPPNSDEQPSSDGSGNHGDNGQRGGDDSNGNGPDGGRPAGSNDSEDSDGSPSNGPDDSNSNPSNGSDGGRDGSNGEPLHDPNGGGSNDQCGGGASGSDPGGKGGSGSEGGSK